MQSKIVPLIECKAKNFTIISYLKKLNKFDKNDFPSSR